MPVERVTKTVKGQPRAGYRWGQHGKVYTYSPGNKVARTKAFAKAARQGRAIKARGG